MRLKTLLLLLALAISPGLTPAVSAEELSLEKKAAIREMMEVTGALRIGTMFADAMVQQMAGTMKQANPDIPPRAFEIMREEVTAIVEQELGENGGFLKLVYPIYSKYLTLEDLRALLAFYKTPVGRKTISVLPQITQESIRAGQIWGQSMGPVIGQRLRQRFEAEGIR